MNLLLRLSYLLPLLISLNSHAQNSQNAKSIEDLINRVDEVNNPASAKDCLPTAKSKKTSKTSRTQSAASKPTPAQSDSTPSALPAPVSDSSSSVEVTNEVQVVKDTAGVDFKISVVSPERAAQLFKNVKVNDLALLEGNSLCKERAQIIGAELESEGIQSGKVFALPTYFGRLYPNPKEGLDATTGWNYHVANTILVKNGSKIETWVLDPYLFNKPVPLTEWETKLKSHPDSRYSQTQITNRYVYDPKQIGAATSKYNPRELMQARARLEGRR